MKIPCEECIVYAICRSKHSSAIDATIGCEDVWNYVVEETKAPDHMSMREWMTSEEHKVREKRMERLKELFPGCDSIEWGGDKF